MQWLLQDFEDTRKLGAVLEDMGRDVSWHKIVPFAGDLLPEPEIKDPNAVLLFGAYSMWRYAEARGLQPGVVRIDPFLKQRAWHPFLLNGSEAMTMPFQDCAVHLQGNTDMWFLRPIEDSKEIPGRVMCAGDIARLSRKVAALPDEDLPVGSLRADTDVMLARPKTIFQEWRLWIVKDRIVSYSRYKSQGRIAYVHEIPKPALAFGASMVQANRGYAPAYVLDICSTADGFRIIETNGLNAAGFYAADLKALVIALEEAFGQN